MWPGKYLEGGGGGGGGGGVWGGGGGGMVSGGGLRETGVGGRDGGGRRGEQGRGGDGWTHPRTVRQMLMRRSAPQPAMRKTPTGGTAGYGSSAGRFERKDDQVMGRYSGAVCAESGMSGRRAPGDDLQRIVRMMIRTRDTGLVPAIFGARSLG